MFQTPTISAVTDKLIPEIKLWQQRPLDSHYPFVWLDAIHYKVKQDGRYAAKAVYTVLGLNLEGRKEILGLYLSETEGANFWLSVLTDLNNRWPARHPDCLCRWPHGLSRGDQRDLSPDRSPALCHPPNPQFSEICSQQKPEGIHG